MAEDKTGVTIAELKLFMDEIDDGARVYFTKGIIEYPLSKDATLLIAHLIDGFLFRHMKEH